MATKKTIKPPARPLAIASRFPVYAMREESLSALLPRIKAEGWDDDEEMDAGCQYEVTGDGVAIITINGALVDAEPEWWFSYFGYVSTPQVCRFIEQAKADANVKAVVPYFLSPGGQCSGIADAADVFFSVRGIKPIIAYAKDICSAAYWLGSQCDAIYIGQDAYVGCIGTLQCIQDWSAFYAEMGVTIYRVTSSGAEVYKGEGASGTKITAAQLEDFKRILDSHQAMFSAGIARGRGISLDDVTALADGRVYVGAEGVTLKLADGVATWETFLSRVSGGDYPQPETILQSPEEKDDNYQPEMVGNAPAAENGERSRPMTKWEKFKALFHDEGDEVDTEAATTMEAASAISAPPNITPAQIAEMVAKGVAEAMGNANAVAAREKVKAAAVRAFGQNAPALEAANASADALTSPETLALLESTYNDIAAKQIEPTGTPQTVTSEQLQSSMLDGLSPEAVALLGNSAVGKKTLARLKEKVGTK